MSGYIVEVNFCSFGLKDIMHVLFCELQQQAIHMYIVKSMNHS